MFRITIEGIDEMTFTTNTIEWIVEYDVHKRQLKILQEGEPQWSS